MESRSPPARVLSRRRWREYVAAYYPGLRLCKSKTDLCDRCERIVIELKSPDLTDERKKALEEEMALHLEEAISQRKV